MNNVISILVGVFIAIMISFNGALSNTVGNYTSSVIIHMVGLIIIIVILIIRGEKLKDRKGTPMILYSAGAMGVLTVIFNNMSFIALGASITIALGLFGQAIASIVIDHFGLFGINVVRFNSKKIIGLSMIVLGIIIMTFF